MSEQWSRCDVCSRKSACVTDGADDWRGLATAQVCCTCSVGDYRAPYDPTCDECKRLAEIKEQSHKRFYASVSGHEQDLTQALTDSIRMVQFRRGTTR